MRVPDWQLREILPALVHVAREAPAPRRTLDDTIGAMVEQARRRGMMSLLAELERDGNGPAEADPSPTRVPPET